MHNKSVEVLERSEDMLLSNSFSLLVDESKIKGQQAELICLEHEDKEASEQPNHTQLKQLNGQIRTGEQAKRSDHQDPKIVENPSTSLESTHSNQEEPSNITRRSGQYKLNIQKPIILIGDSIIKHIDPRKLSRRTVYKYTYPGKTCEEVNKAVDDINTELDPSHVIVHCGTNNLVTDSADVCITKVKNLLEKLKKKFPNAEIGVSGLTYREDIDVNSIRVEVNEELKKLSLKNNFAYIDISTIDKTCLNGSKLHLNGKGSSLLAVRFIKLNF